MSPQDRPDFLSEYAHLPVGGVWWTRKVHYDREKDILWIKDAVSTGDKKPHRLRFNWISPELQVQDAGTVKLAGGYTLVGKSLDPRAALISELRTHREGYEEFQAMLKKDPGLKQYAKDAEGYIWKSVYSGVDAPAAQIVWAIGKDTAALRACLEKHRGAFISEITSKPVPGGVELSWKTDEPATGKVSVLRGTLAPLSKFQTETPLAEEHKLLLPLPGKGLPLAVTIAVTDQHGGVTTAEATLQAGR
jgi:hypothetical protein